MNLRFDAHPTELADEDTAVLVCFLCDADGPDVAASAEDTGDGYMDCVAVCQDQMACMGRLATQVPDQREAPQTAQLAGTAV